MSFDNKLDEYILNLVQSNDVSEQGDLQKILKEHGFDVSQATLSRHLKRLKIVKIATGVYKATDTQLTHVPLVLNILVSDFGMLILHTLPGHANGLAYVIDQRYVNQQPHENKGGDILGTIAGDDTVLVIVKDKSALERVVALLREDFSYHKS